jgi:AcrR family transcriptional regulator
MASRTDGLAALSMARLAERLGCGTMSLYRHVANKDEQVTFMLAAGPGPPPSPPAGTDWRGALTNWARELWGVYHRHPWILQTASAGPPVDPGQLAWLDAGLARFPALATAIDAGVFDQPDDGPLSEFHSGLGQLLDGIASLTR